MTQLVTDSFIEKHQDKVRTLEIFGKKLENILGVSPLPYVTMTETGVLSPKGKWYRELKKDVFVLDFRTDCYKLLLTTHNENTIELNWIEVNSDKRCKGSGTELINILLDISDETGISVRTIPADIDNPEGDIEVLYRLRRWYKSFGFKPSTLTPSVFYYKQKNIS